MVIRSSSVGLMHILMRRSSLKVTSQALAWQTTSRSRGLVNIDRSQKRLGQRVQAQRGEERLAGLHHLHRVPLLAGDGRRHVEDRLPLVGLDQRVDVGPFLGPHVAQQVGGQVALGRHLVLAVGLRRQLAAHVAVQLLVERPHLLPQPLGLLLELRRRHVVRRPPHLPRVREADLPGALVGQLDEAGVDRAADRGRCGASPARRRAARAPCGCSGTASVSASMSLQSSCGQLAFGAAGLGLAVDALHLGARGWPAPGAAWGRWGRPARRTRAAGAAGARVSASAGAWAKLAACFTAWLVNPSSSSLAAAACRSVSSVMYVFLIHSAVSERTCSLRSCSLTEPTNRLASAGCA